MQKRVVNISTMKATKSVREYMASIGRKGGKSRNPRKALPTEQARANALARWNRPGARKTEKAI
jgi:hypothetical protein